MAARTGPDVRQFTVRFPADVWADLSRELGTGGGHSMNDVSVEMVAAELTRQRRRRVLAELAAQRAELVRQSGAAQDSTPYIRSLREGSRGDE